LMAEFVVKSIHSEGNRRAYKMGIGTAWARNFMLGAAVRIRERVYEIRDAAEKATSKPAGFIAGPAGTIPGTAVVLASVYKTESEANEAFIKSRIPMVRQEATRAKGATDYAALMEGRAYGDRVRLETQLGNGGAK
jgi:hypothetical protein